LIQILKHQKEAVSDRGMFLSAIGKSWIYGVDIRWEAIDRTFPGKRIPLPTYPFDRKRYWVDTKLNELGAVQPAQRSCGAANDTQLIKKVDPSDWFYFPRWERIVQRKEVKLKEGNYLVFKDSIGIAEQYTEPMKTIPGHHLVYVTIGDTFTEIDRYNYRIDPRQEDDYIKLFENLKEEGLLPDHILHFLSLTEPTDRETQIKDTERIKDLGLYSMLYICKSIGHVGLSGNIEFNVISNGLFQVGGIDYIYPEKATILGPVKVIPLEYQNIKTRIADIVVNTSWKTDISNLPNILGMDTDDLILAVRGKYTFRQTYVPEKIERTENLKFRNKGVYVVIGGQGGIGFTISKFLAERYKANVVIISRAVFPEKEKWSSLTGNIHNDFSLKINEITDLEKNGAMFTFKKADVSDLGEMEKSIAEIYGEFGEIHGIIHSAGEVDYAGIIQKRNRSDTDRLLQAKMKGMQVIEKIFSEKSLDFIAMFSSIANIVYELKFGQVGYNAANEFLDLYSYMDCRHYVTSINWTDWSYVGMTHRTLEGKYHPIIDQAGIKPDEGTLVFDRIINHGLSQTVVISSDLKNVKLSLQKSIDDAGEEKTPEKKNRTSYKRPDLTTEYVAPADELERKLIQIWEDSFGFEGLGVNDNFFELGGDSLKGMRFVNRYKEMLDDIVHVSVVFDAVTIRELAEYFKVHYPQAIARIQQQNTGCREKFREEKEPESIREFISGINACNENSRVETPAVFILSPLRSGSTLLRVMMAAHDKLFSPQEISIMQYGNLSEISDDLAQVQAILRTIMELKSCTKEEAYEFFADFRNKHMDVIEFFNVLSELAGNRIFVHKSPGYALNEEVLQKIKKHFKNVKFIHLQRNPYAMIRSFEEAKIDLFVNKELIVKYNHNRRKLAEHIWYGAHINIDRLKAESDPGQFLTVKFEDMVENPELVSRQVCEFLGIDFQPGMLDPYSDSKKLMTDGVTSEGMMVGDVKFHNYRAITKEVAYKWIEDYDSDFLSDKSLVLAKQMGYGSIAEGSGHEESVMVYRTSPQQRRLFERYTSAGQEFLKLVEHFIQVFILKGKLDRKQVGEAVQKLIYRHDGYRTGFEYENGEVIQKVYAHADAKVIYCQSEDNDKAVREAIDEHVKSFDLSTPPLMEVLLIQVQPEKYFVVINSNHMITDGASQLIIVDEIGSLLQGKPFEPVKYQYKDYVNWFYGEQNQINMEKKKDFWVSLFAEKEIPCLNVPVDYERTPDKGKYGFSTFVQFDKEFSEQLKDFARKNKTSLYTLLMNGYFILLNRLSQQKQIIVGTSVSGRSEEFNTTIGYFLNLIPIFMTLENDMKIMEILDKLSQTIIGSLDNKDYQFEQLIEDLKVENDPLRHPVFNAFFHYINHDYTKKASTDSDLMLIEYGYEGKAAKFELELVGRDEGQNVLVYFIYRSNLFARETVEKYISMYQSILRQIVNDVDLKLGDVSLEEKR